ncbi:MAG: acyl-CoA synthetase, partial [Ilumatobacteraceae bacterium]
MRVDGENFAAAPIERIVLRFPGVILAAVYGVPDETVGDQVMAAIQLDESTRFDPVAFAEFLVDQPDLGSKWAPRYVRIVDHFPMTQTNKILKRELVLQRWDTTDSIWIRRARDLVYEPLQGESATP